MAAERAAATTKQAGDRLEAYRAKRDFTVTSEPAGTTPPVAGGNRFVVQRHRARRLHYDLRLEMAGVLVSWAVPKGPTLDPNGKRLAVHVEDHPLDYFDFEGVIPGGEYGGGDVIVWDWGRWEPAETTDPLAAIQAGELHFDLHGEKLGGRFVLLRRGAEGRDEWLLLKKRDEFAEPGWDPEQHPRSVKSGRSNDQVKASPSASWSSTASWAAPTPEELAALDTLGKAGRWRLGEHELKLTNLDKVLFPPDPAHPALTKRDLVRHHATMAPVMLPYLVERPVNLHRFPDGVDRPGFWHKAVPSHAPDWLRRWRNPDADPGETEEYLVIDTPAALAWVANYGAIEVHPWTSTVRDPHRPTWALMDIDPGEASSFEDVLIVARLHRTALDHLGVQGRAEGQRPARDPDLDPGRRALHVRRHPRVGRAGVAGHRIDRARARQLGVGGGQARRPHPPRLHPERHQQDLDRTVQRPPRSRSAGVGADQLGRARRPGPAAGPVDDPRRRRACAPRRRPAGAADRSPPAAPGAVTQCCPSRSARSGRS